MPWNDDAYFRGIERRARLKRNRALRARAPMKRSPIKSIPKESLPRLWKQRVRDRSKGRCEAKTPVCSGTAAQIHHRKMRSQGGKNTLANLLDVCGPCHAWIHHHPAESYEKGWLIRRSA